MDKLFYCIFGSDKKRLADENGRYFLQTVMLMSMLGSICLWLFLYRHIPYIGNVSTLRIF